MIRKNKSKGFTLIEVVVAVAIVALISGFVIASSFVIPQTKMKQTAQTFKTQFEVARNYAKSHGGITQFLLTKTEDGMEITTIGVEGKENDKDDNKKVVKDASLEVYYWKTGESGESKLNYGESLLFQFSQMEGSIIGPDLVDYVRLDNKSKDYKILIEHKTGMLYYDYELDSNYKINNTLNVIDSDGVETPTFIKDGLLVKNTSIVQEVKRRPGESVQPEINYDSRYIKIGGIYRAESGGPYTITFTLKDPYEKQWKQNSSSWTPTEDEPFEVKELYWRIVE